MQVGEMPYSVLSDLNSEFAPAFSFDEQHYEFVGLMWSHAANAAELVSDELGITEQHHLEAEATARVGRAMRVLLYGDPA